MANPNHEIVDDFRKDDNGNIIGCPKCGARAMRKDGFSYYAETKKQRYKQLEQQFNLLYNEERQQLLSRFNLADGD